MLCKKFVKQYQRNEKNTELDKNAEKTINDSEDEDIVNNETEDDNDNKNKSFVEFELSPELQQVIHRDWGLYYKRINSPSIATINLKKALLLNKQDARSHTELSECKLIEANCKDALKSAEKALKMNPKNFNVKFQYIRTLYENGLFEKSLINAHNTYYESSSNNKRMVCKDSIDINLQAIDQVVGKDAGPCLFKARKVIKKIIRDDARIINDKRPRWKILKEKNECDVESNCVIPKPTLKLKCKKRRALNFTVVNHMYFDKSTANDINFLNGLIVKPEFKLSQIPESSSYIEKVLKKHYEQLVAFKTMLKTRHTLYAKRFLMIKDEERATSHKAETLLKVQIQTRRDVFRQLCHILELYHRGSIGELLKYAEQILSQYYSIKRPSVFPTRFIFLNEIYNIVGLAYLDKLTVPIDLMKTAKQHRLLYLLDLPIEQRSTPTVKTIYGNKKFYKQPSSVKYNTKIQYFEDRCRWIIYPIERCYLYHEIGILHLAQQNIYAASSMSKGIINASKEAGNCVWEILGYMLYIRCTTLQQNHARARQTLSTMAIIAKNMNDKIQQYIETVILLIDEEILRKRRQEQELMFSQD